MVKILKNKYLEFIKYINKNEVFIKIYAISKFC